MFDSSVILEQAQQYTIDNQSFYMKFVEKALAESDASKIQDIGYELTGERRQFGHIIELGAPVKKGSLWDKILSEIYDLLCTQSSKYKDERAKGVGSFQHLVGVVSASVGATVHVGVGILSGLAAVALVLIAKMGRNAWCSMQKDQMGSV